jgi:thiamine biosynthesis lipoprotein
VKSFEGTWKGRSNGLDSSGGVVRISASKRLCQILGLLLILLSGCHPKSTQIVRDTQFIMGTLVEITLVARDDEATAAAMGEAFDEMRRIERLMSRSIEESEIWRVNRAAGKDRVSVSDDLLSVLRIALEVSRLSEGSFDVTVGALVGLWGRCWNENRVPSTDEVGVALGEVGYRDVEIDEEKGTVFLKGEGVELALGGIAKGYAVDQAFRFLQDQGFRDLIVNAGGDLRSGGTKFGSPWVVGIQDPRDPSGMIAKFRVRDAAIATSGDYERFFTKDGIRYHHIVDPTTGFPARGCRSVTILSGELVWADALATAVFVLGPQKGMALVERISDTEALIVDANGQMTLSSGMGKKIVFQ